MRFDYYPDEIASAIIKATGENSLDIISGCINALYQLQAICQNEYNSEYYRTFYKMLEKITNIINSDIIAH